ncbi:hypothetical protein RHSIM_Rhsim05G0020900 [Rhododendron simsii]|uniref:BED-type domain-containing protein n=1 Tax=Rhododendron simsii TaxID=118357 RepID=A0A834GWV5_RHOSS|nr:hypothetical protein RHSIM_Rhsim05G0020900 [Rhododendron simsii]
MISKLKILKLFMKKARKKTSHVWDDFDTVTHPDGSKKSQCKFCKQTYCTQVSGPTTQLIRHLNNCVQRKLALGSVEKKQKMLSFETIESDSVNLTTFKYDHAKVREAASHMLLYHEYPFMHVEHVLFNKFMRTVSPYWQKISRTTAKNDSLMTYNLQKKKLVTTLKSVNRISIITDLWKSGQKIHYMVVTGHFIDDNWKLQKRVLNFCYVPLPHSGNLQGTFKLLKKKLLFDGKLFHVRCCAHIINLMVQDGLSVIGGVIECVREAVKYLVASEPRLIQFSEIAKQLQLPSKKLILDCPTRWNSAYLMLSAALEFKDVFPRYSERDLGFAYVPSYEEWEKVERVCQFLEIFNDVTNIISGSEYPTSNLFLTELKDSLYELYNEYVALHSQAYNELISQQSTTAADSLNSASLGRKVVTGRSKYESFVRQSDSIQPVKSDLDIYLEEGVYICQQGMDSEFDALEWWKANSLKYRILSKMARDILSIPITSVASESTFSAGSRVIDPYRASLATDTVEMLLCGADWVRAYHGLKKGSDVVAVLQVTWKWTITFGTLSTQDILALGIFDGLFYFVMLLNTNM